MSDQIFRTNFAKSGHSSLTACEASQTLAGFVRSAAESVFSSHYFILSVIEKQSFEKNHFTPGDIHQTMLEKNKKV